MDFVSFLVEDREAGQAYVRSHLSTAIFVADFLQHGRAAPDEHQRVEDHIAALQRLQLQVKYVAAPPKPKDMTSFDGQGAFCGLL